MELKQLDINEFYREENAYYIKNGMSVPEGLGSLILITPKQTIGFIIFLDLIILKKWWMVLGVMERP